MEESSETQFFAQPGQWFEFTEENGEIPSDMKGPYKVLLQNIDPFDRNYEKLFIFSKEKMNMLEYRPQGETLGTTKIPSHASIRILNSTESNELNRSASVVNTTRAFLKALVWNRDGYLTYDPDNGQQISSQTLRAKFHPLP